MERRVQLVSCVPMLVLFLVMGLILVSAKVPDLWPFGLFLGAAVWVPYYLYARQRQLPWIRYLDLLLEHQRSCSTAALQQRAVVIDDGGVTITADMTRMTLFWQNFEDVVTFDSHVMLTYTEKCNGICFPLSAFGEVAQSDAAIANLRAWLILKGVDQSIRCRAAVASDSFACECGHDLIGLTTNVCPECGKRWTYFGMMLETSIRKHGEKHRFFRTLFSGL
jgi:hypothetical protein